MATATKINNQTTTTVNMAPLLLILDRIKEDANQSLGENEKLKGELNSKIDRIIKGTDITTTAENANELAGIISKSSELRNSGGIGVMAKRIELEAEKLIEQYPKEIEELRKEDFKENFDKELIEKNSKIDELQLKNAQEYRDLVAKNSFDKSIIDGQQNIALENNEPLFGPGKIENAWMDLKTTVNFLQKSPEEIKNIKEKYNSLKGKLDGVNLPTDSKEARSFERMMGVLNNPKADDLFSRTKKYLGWADRVDKMTGGWLNKTVTDAGVKVFEKIGNQAIQEFTTNALGQMAQHGFQQGFSNVLNGILSGGVQATATTTASGVGTGVAVGGTAAATATGAAAGGTAAATGAAAASAAVPGIGWIVAAAIVALGAIKKIGNTIAEKLGISSKAFFEDNFGKVGGFFVKAAMGLVALPAMLIGLMSATMIGPIIIAVVIGLFGYQLFQGSLVSSLVPPKGTESTTVEIPVAAGGNYDITDGTEIKTCNGGPIIVPQVPTNFSRQDLYNVAMSLVGKVPYFWAGGYSAKGPDPTWNKVKKIVSCSGNAWNNPVHYSCGKAIFNGIDCSGYVLWVYYQLVGRDISSHSSGDMYNKAANGIDGWRFVNENELKIGDIGWKSGHVGIFAGRNTNGEKMFIHAWNVEGCMGKTVYNRFTKFIRPNVKFSDD